MSQKVVIVGAGHGAGQLAASLRQKKYAGEIVLVGDEPYYPYQRPPLSKKYLAGELPVERLFVKPQNFYADQAIDVRLNTRIASIDRGSNSVLTGHGDTIHYDVLVLATGSRARTLHCPGADLAGVSYLRTVQDVDNIRRLVAAGRQIVIVGAGYIGLEVAAVTRQLGMDVTVVEVQDRVMSRVVCPKVARFYQNEHEAHGVRLMLSTGLSGFSGNGQVSTVHLEHGDPLPVDVVVVGIGIEPDTELAAGAGLALGDGIVVDDRCRTSDRNIYAIGDCTFHPNGTYGRRLRLESVHNALEQAKTAAANICGEDVVYSQVPWFWSDQYDLKLQIAGLSQGYDETVLRGDPGSRSFACAYLREGALIAVDAINSPKDFMQSKSLIAAGASPDRQLLSNPEIELKDTW